MQTTTGTPMTREPDISTYHHGAAMVNVKDRIYWPGDSIAGPLIDELDERTVEACYERARECFWDQARDIAQDHGYDDVFSDGGSGGWLGAMRNGRAVSIDYDRWASGEYGPCDEWDQFERDEWDRFRAFAGDVVANMDHCADLFREFLGDARVELEDRRDAAIERGDN